MLIAAVAVAAVGTVVVGGVAVAAVLFMAAAEAGSAGLGLKAISRERQDLADTMVNADGQQDKQDIGRLTGLGCV